VIKASNKTYGNIIMINREINDSLGSIVSATILNEYRVAFCSPLNKENSISNAIIYDYNEKKIVAHYQSKKGSQIAFYRTTDPKLALCCHSNHEMASAEQKDEFFELENAQNKVINELETITNESDNSSLLKSRLDNIISLLNDSVKYGEDINRILSQQLQQLGKRCIASEPNALLIDFTTLKINEKPIIWCADNCIKVNNTEIFIEQPFKGRKPGLDTSSYYDLDAYLAQRNTRGYFHIFFDHDQYYRGTWSSPPPFQLARYSPQSNNDKYTLFEGYLMSTCRMDDHLLMGCKIPWRQVKKSFMIGFWDINKKKWALSRELNHVIEKLNYIPEKEIAIGYIEGAISGATGAAILDHAVKEAAMIGAAGVGFLGAIEGLVLGALAVNGIFGSYEDMKEKGFKNLKERILGREPNSWRSNCGFALKSLKFISII
jgi:hypothetical protein